MKWWILLLACVWTPASAHMWVKADGTVVDAGWIEKDFPSCCGKQDCEPIDERRVHRQGSRWTVRGLGGSVQRTHLSRDGKTWACRNLSDNTLRCLFLPGLN